MATSNHEDIVKRWALYGIVYSILKNVYLPKSTPSLVLVVVFDTLLSLLVKNPPFLFILEDFIGIIDVVKFGHCIFIVWVFVRMVFDC